MLTDCSLFRLLVGSVTETGLGLPALPAMASIFEDEEGTTLPLVVDQPQPQEPAPESVAVRSECAMPGSRWW